MSANKGAILDYMARNFVAADFSYATIPDKTVLLIAVPHGTPVSVDLIQTIERAMQREVLVSLSPVPDVIATLTEVPRD